GTTSAPVAEAQPAPAAVPVSAARMSSPAGNANDPVDGSLGNDPSLDLTGATLSVSASKGVVATLSGPAIGSAPPPEAGGGISFFVAWLYNNKVYYARANQTAPGSWTFTSGDTGTYGQSSTYGYNDDATTAATGTVDTAHGKITIDIPASEVGSPKAGALLADPQAFAQLNLGTPAVWVALTADSADNLAPVSKDGGYAESVGEAVTVRS
ncbi:MAG TPA: hypothetical protein VGR90_09260, partial [Acidimicrobiales bacterium]|nr:hypothetical protein [Acidimicrobiales bacterium]